MAPTTARRQEQTDAIALLKKDHEEVRGLLDDLEPATGAARRRRLLEEVRDAIKAHSTCEEEIFYPAYHGAATQQEERKLFFEAAEEHHVVDGVLAEMESQDPTSDEFAAKAKVLEDLVEHHAEEEEGEMFPKAKKLLARAQLVALGAQIEERKRELEGRRA